MPQNPFDLWGQISSDQRFQSLPGETQQNLKMFYYKRFVLPYATPQNAAQLQHTFFAPELAQQEKADVRAETFNQGPLEGSTYRKIAMATGMPTSEDMQPGAGKAVARFGEELTTPTNMALAIGGMLGGGVALGGRLGAMAGYANAGLRAGRIADAAMSTYFEGQMGYGGYQSGKAALHARSLAAQAEAAGDHELAGEYKKYAAQYLTESVLNTGMAGLAGFHGFREGQSAVTGMPTPHEAMRLRSLGWDPNALKGRFDFQQAILSRGLKAPATALAPEEQPPTTSPAATGNVDARSRMRMRNAKQEANRARLGALKAKVEGAPPETAPETVQDTSPTQQTQVKQPSVINENHPDFARIKADQMVKDHGLDEALNIASKWKNLPEGMERGRKVGEAIYNELKSRQVEQPAYLRQGKAPVIDKAVSEAKPATTPSPMPAKPIEDPAATMRRLGTLPLDQIMQMQRDLEARMSPMPRDQKAIDEALGHMEHAHRNIQNLEAMYTALGKDVPAPSERITNELASSKSRLKELGLSDEEIANHEASFRSVRKNAGDAAKKAQKPVSPAGTPEETEGNVSPEGTKLGEGLPQSRRSEEQEPVETGPVWVSKLEKTVQSKMQGPMPAEALGNMLRNAGVTADEMKWTGTDDFLKANPKVTKEALLNHLRENQVQVMEVTKGQTVRPEGPHEARLAQINVRIDQLANMRRNLELKYDDTPVRDIPAYTYAQMSPADIQVLKDNMSPEDIASLQEIDAESSQLWQESDMLHARGIIDRTASNTQYESYTLPGGTNYREVLLQLPHKNEYAKSMSDAEVNALGPNAKRVAMARAGNYRSPHFDEPNILAHMRLKDRVDAEGKKVLFVEEVQSDWHQAGKKYGYRDTEYEKRMDDLAAEVVKNNKEYTKAHDELAAAVKEIAASRKLPSRVEGNMLVNEDPVNKARHLVRHLDAIYTDDTRFQPTESALAFAQGNRLRQLQGRLEGLAKKEDDLTRAFDRMRRDAVPPAPFAQHWHALAMKRILRMAAEEGYDKVAWTTGKQQAARYNLNKYVDQLHYRQEADGYHLYTGDQSSGTFRPVATGLKEEKLDEYVGRDVAQRIRTGVGEVRNAGWKTLKGLYLEVGGESHKRLYDQMLPQWANHYGKKWGARVEKTQVDIGEKSPVVGGGYSYTEAHGIDITPEMRRSVMQGQNLFGEGLPQKRDRLEVARQDATDALLDRAKANIAAHGDLEYRPDTTPNREWESNGIITFHDNKTGTTFGRTLAEVANPDHLKQIVADKRADFAKGKAAGGAEGLPLVQRLFSHMPILKTLSEDQAVKVVAQHTDGLLREAAENFGTAIEAKGRILQQGRDFAEMHYPGLKLVHVRGQSFFDRIARSLAGEHTVNEAMAHGIGHSIFHDLDLGDKDLGKLFPDQRKVIESYYSNLSDKQLNSEVFAEAFKDWYNGKLSDTKAAVMDRLLKSNPDAWKHFSDLKGVGSTFKPGQVQLSMKELAYAKAIDEPGEGIPFTSLGHTVLDKMATVGDKTPQRAAAERIAIERMGGLARYKEQLFHRFNNTLKLHDDDSIPDLKRIADLAERKPGAQGQLSPEEQAAVAAYRQVHDENWSALKTIKPGRFSGDGIENYFKHLFKNPNNALPVIQRILATKRPLQGPATFLAHRFYDFMSDAIAAGAEPVTNNFFRMQLLGAMEVRRYINAHQILADMKSEGLARFFKVGAKSKGLIPDGWQRINDQIFQPRVPGKGSLTMYGEYWAHPDAAKVMNNYLSPGLRGNAVYDTLRAYGNFLNQMQLGWSGFHGMFESFETSIADVALGIQKAVSGDKHAGAVQAGRAFLPGASAVHYYRLGRMIDEEYLEPGKYPALSNFVSELTRAGIRRGVDPYYESAQIDAFKQARANGKSLEAVVRSIPAFTEWSSRWLMKYFVPRLKLGVAAEMAQHRISELTKSGITDPKAVAEDLDKVVASVDNRMGQLTYDNRFWNKVHKDLAMLSIRSVGWNVGTISEIGGGLLDVPKNIAKVLSGRKVDMSHRLAYTMAMPVVIGTYGAAINYLATGQMPQQAEDYFFPRTGKLDAGGKPARLSLPGYMKDVWAVGSEAFGSGKPGQTVLHKLHPMWTQLAELYQNQDYYGREIYHTQDSPLKRTLDKGEYLLSGLIPISVKNAMQRARTGESWLPHGLHTGALLGAEIGLSPAPAYIGQTKAEQLSYDYARRSFAQGPKTTEQAAHMEARSKLRNMLALKDPKTPDTIKDMLKSGAISFEDVGNIATELQQSPLERHFSRLQLPEALEVMEVATPNERVQLRSEFAGKLSELAKYPPDVQQKLSTRIQKVLQ